MKDAFREGRVVSGPIFGYKLEFCLDGSGQPIQVNGKHPRRMVVNTEIAPWVVKMFEMYGIDRRSLKQIATHFNEVRAGDDVDGGECDRETTQDKRYIGIEEYWRREKRNQGTNTVFRPEEEWLKRDIPALRIVSDDLWQKVPGSTRRVFARFQIASFAITSERQ